VKSKNLTLIIIGIGKMGGIVFRALPAIFESLLKEEINIDNLYIIDADDKKLEKLQFYSEEFKYSFNIKNKKIFFSSIRSLINEEFKEKNKNDFIFIYDSSPTPIHSENISYFNLNLESFKHVYYLCEKPITSDKGYLCLLQGYINSSSKNFEVCTSLPEIYNPAYMTLKKYIDENNCKIKHLSFFRFSSMGFDKIFTRNKRQGVAGGALEDKAIHDLSLTFDLLNINKLKLKYNIRFNNSSKNCGNEMYLKEPADINIDFKLGENPLFMPSDFISLNSSAPNFMTVDNGQNIENVFLSEPVENDDYYWSYAADCNMNFHINWFINNQLEPIPSDYYVSWIGLMGEFQDYLKDKFGIIFDDFYFEGENNFEEYACRSYQYSFSFKEEEARIIIAEIEKDDNSTELLICNTLQRTNGIKNIKYWVKKLIKRNNDFTTQDLGLIKNNDLPFNDNYLLKFIFKKIVDFCNGKEIREDKITIFSHLIISEVREKLFNSLSACNNINDVSGNYINKARSLFNNRILMKKSSKNF